MHRVEALVSQLSPSGVAAKKPSAELVSSIVQQGVAVLSINYPPVNAFNIHVRDAISKAYDAAVANDEVKAIVITGNKTTFMAGPFLSSLDPFFVSSLCFVFPHLCLCVSIIIDFRFLFLC